jgi:hypothetical protein
LIYSDGWLDELQMFKYNFSIKPAGGESTPQYNGKKYEHRPSETCFPIEGLQKIKENSQCVHRFSISYEACLNSGRLTSWELPGVEQIMSKPLCFVIARPRLHQLLQHKQ